MKLLSTLFLLFLLVRIASFHLLPAEQTNREFKERVREQRRIGETRLQDRQPRSVSTLKVLDFSADGDQQPDSNGKYTGASLEAGPLPESFTICTAFMAEAFTTVFSAAYMFVLLDDDGYKWIHMNLFAAYSHTEFEVSAGEVKRTIQTDHVFFPLQWTRACLSLDSSKIKMVANGQLLVDEEYKEIEDTERPVNLSLRLGFDVDEYGSAQEYIGKFTNLNFFNSSLPG